MLQVTFDMFNFYVAVANLFSVFQSMFFHFISVGCFISAVEIFTFKKINSLMDISNMVFQTAGS